MTSPCNRGHPRQSLDSFLPDDCLEDHDSLLAEATRAEDALKAQEIRNITHSLLRLPGSSGTSATTMTTAWMSPGSSGRYLHREGSCMSPRRLQSREEPCDVESVRAEFARLLEDERETRSEAVREVLAICAALTLSFEGRVQELTRAVYQDIECENMMVGTQLMQASASAKASGSEIYQQAENLVSTIRRRLGDRCWDQLTALRIDVARLDGELAKERTFRCERAAPVPFHASTRFLQEMAEDQQQMPEHSGMECSTDLASKLQTELTMRFDALETDLRARIAGCTANLESTCRQAVEIRLGALGRDLCRELDTRLEGLETALPVRVGAIEKQARCTEAGLASFEVDVRRRMHELQQTATLQYRRRSPRNDAIDHLSNAQFANDAAHRTERSELAVPELDLGRCKHVQDRIVEWETSMHPKSFSAEVNQALDAVSSLIQQPVATIMGSSTSSALADSDHGRTVHSLQPLVTCIDHLQGSQVGGVSHEWGHLQSSSGLHGSPSIPRGFPVSPPCATRGHSYQATATVPPLSPSRHWFGPSSTTPAPRERPSSPTRSPAMGGARVVTPLHGVSHILDQSRDSSQMLVQPWVQRLSSASAYTGGSTYSGPFRMRSDVSPRSTMPQLRVLVRSPSHSLQASSHSNLQTPAMPSGPPPVHQSRRSGSAQIGAGPFAGHGSPQLVASRCASRTPQTRQTFHAATSVAARAPTMVNGVPGDSTAPISPVAMRTGSRSTVRLGF